MLKKPTPQYTSSRCRVPARARRWRTTFTNIVDNTSQYGPFAQANAWAQKA